MRDRTALFAAVSVALLAQGGTALRADAQRKPQAAQRDEVESVTTITGKLRPRVVEIESLMPHIKASAGDTTVQDMTSFGPDWGGSAQVLWRPPAPVDTPIRNWPHLRFSIDVPQGGIYAMTLVHTQAPDYGSARVFVRGKARADLPGYAPSVRNWRTSLGSIQLQAGSNEVVVTVFGKDPASTGFIVGLDRIEMQRK